MNEVLKDLLAAETKRQEETVELIASENFVSDDVLAALGTCLTNKYTEGYPGNRYYGGCKYYDEIELYCQKRWLEVFKADGYHVNVQPHSGSNANFAAYLSVLNPGDGILSMSLQNGAHLTHGSPVNFSGKLYTIYQYGLTDAGVINYDEIEEIADVYNPKLLLAGASAYSREIDFKRMYNIAKNHNMVFMVDMAHIAGLVATGFHNSPFGYADIITTTTQKTLRGPRGGLIFCKDWLSKRVDSAVFPGTQGGALQNVILAKAVAADEAMSHNFIVYIGNVVHNASCMAKCFIDMGYNVVSGGTDNHLFMLDFSETHPWLTGKALQDYLDSPKYNITLNKNAVPNDYRSPKETSGVRIGTAAMTTKGWGSDDFINVSHKIDTAIKELDSMNIPHRIDTAIKEIEFLDDLLHG